MCQPTTTRGMSEREIDAEFVAIAARGGSEGQRAFAQIVKRHEARVRRVAYGVLRNDDDARDAAQEVFVRVWRRIGEFDDKSASFGTWVYRIASNIAIDCYRRRARGNLVSLDSLDPDTLHTIASTPHLSASSIDRGNDNAGRFETARNAVKSLSEKHQEVLLLREAEGLSYAEIAARTGLKRGTVMSRLFYARKYAASQCVEATF